MSIEVRDINKKFGDYSALANINLIVENGGLTALLGPSGSGKTTLLRIIAGLENADSGKIIFDGVDVTNNTTRSRGIGFVFQHYALFRNMSVFENIAFGLRVKAKKDRPSENEIQKRVKELLSLVQLAYHEKSYPHELSGGQKQRIALARALAVEPKILLLDEPFGALDAKVRKELRAWLRKLHDDTGVTSLFVTHDQEEALEVADKIVVMNKAKIEQVGSPEEVYAHPINPFVYGFLGEVNLFHDRKSQNETVTFVRPHDVDLHDSSAEDRLEAEVIGLRVVGGTVRVELSDTHYERSIEAHISMAQKNALNLAIGSKCYFSFRTHKQFDKEEFLCDYVI
ncbi:MAG: hypothetical protein RL154_1475 [Pseudomonadota bacterium]|jgi:sulfate transport system ATP-binding protein